MTTTSQLASDFLAITANLDSMPEGVSFTLYRHLCMGSGEVFKFCARVELQHGNEKVCQTIEADTAAECLLMLARLLP